MTRVSRRHALAGLSLAGTLAAVLAADEVQAAQIHMQRALDNLEDAEDQLIRASNDKGGHRGKALSHVRQAIKEVKRGIQYDYGHGKKR